MAKLKTLRHATTGGESLTIELIDKFCDTTEKAGLSIQLHNCYGPSEAAITSTHWICTRGGLKGRVPIGHPVDNTHVYVLDSRGQPLPSGVPGELYIGGPQVGLGYWQRDSLTRERFIPDPFSEDKPAKLYRTGDRVRFLEDGSLEFLGRFDRQLKIHGLRIEPGEIESTISSFQHVEDSIVDVSKTTSGDSRLVAYLKTSEAKMDLAKLRSYLKARLPKHMVPAAFVVLESFPLLSSGKIDFRALPEPKLEREDLEAPFTAPGSETEQSVTRVFRELLDLKKIGTQDNFFDVGATSLLLLSAFKKLNTLFPESKLTTLDLFQNPTVKSLAARLTAATQPSTPASEPASQRKTAPTLSESIAIIGMSGRFPQAENLDEFWKLIAEGKEGITQFTEDELSRAGIAEEVFSRSDYVPASGVNTGYDLFDERFFGYTPKEASIIDPQQRLFLEEAWHALENAGYDPARFEGRIGVFAGMGRVAYMRDNLYANPKTIAMMGEWQTAISNEACFLSTRVSYKFNLSGPSVSIQTACSTSLVALHMARQSLLLGESDIVLAGGVRLLLGKQGYLYQPGAIHSPDGHCRPFDAKAAGTVPGSGVGVVALKRLSEALEDGDTIHAIIRGSAINNDGAQKVGFSAPSPQRQAAVIADALRVSKVEADQVAYIEAHGTATPVGDPIEIAGLKKAFKSGGDKKHFCAIGSVKANIGHADAAAGIAGLLKVVLSFKHSTIPPSLNFES
ncbi:MAG: AMP-binding protein, partial [Verrucomicrobiae bacterium]|nr:AMP-binding protein [Verrucomicrobiae bacterium]